MLDHTRDRCFLGWLNLFFKKLKKDGKLFRYFKDPRAAKILKKS